MKLKTELYQTQLARWPKTGRHILAQFDEESIVVYQAYTPSIAEYALSHQRFGGPFSYERMSWIKPNFLWMMFRCGWASKFNQESVLAVRLRRAGFEAILREAVHSSFVRAIYETEEKWGTALDRSDVRMQWDPDHHPSGAKVERRAIQLGLKGETLRRYGTEWIVSIEDITQFCRQQHEHVAAKRLDLLVTPKDVYALKDSSLRNRITECTG
ncbi:MAG TPA: DUF4291 domain-containing protein [Planctomycetota bacterium]|nr:DUF4291 domain-containing protein [Planctomycetota bacterium]